MAVSFPRYSHAVTHNRRWPALRQAAKRRDGWKCVQCGGRQHLEVDHVQPVRTHPELSFDLGNLQTLCRSCHTKKTRLECGLPTISEARQKWRDAVRDMSRGGDCSQSNTGEEPCSTA